MVEPAEALTKQFCIIAIAGFHFGGKFKTGGVVKDLYGDISKDIFYRQFPI